MGGGSSYYTMALAYSCFYVGKLQNCDFTNCAQMTSQDFTFEIFGNIYMLRNQREGICDFTFSPFIISLPYIGWFHKQFQWPVFLVIKL